MALTFEEYVSGRRRNEQTAGSGKLSFDDYVKMTSQQTAPQNDALMDLAMETVQAKTHNDNHDVLHGVFTPKTTKTIGGDISAPVGKVAELLSIPSGNVAELPKLISAGVQALKTPESVGDYFGIKQKTEPVNQNPAADFYLRQKQNQQAEEIKKQQDALITQIKVIDRKREAAKREANSGTTMQQRANLSGLANTAARENAQAYMEGKYANLRELDRQRAELIDQLHAIGGKYGVGDFVGDFLDSFQAASQTPLATLDKTDYWASANAGLISTEDQAAYDRAHALENDIAQQTAAAKSGRGKAGQVAMDAAAAAGNVLGSTAFAYATGIPQAAQQFLGPVAANLSATEAQLGAKAGERVAAGAQRFAGNLLGDIVANPTNFVISAQSGIGAYDRAKTAGASETAAFAAALGNAAAEYFSNKMFSGTPLLDSPEEKGYVVELIEAAAEKAGRSGQAQALFNNGLVSYVFDKSGEGLEEVITGVLDPLIERLTYNPDADRATAEELFNEFIGGVAMSLLLGAAEPVTNFQGRKAEARANEAAAAAYYAATGGASLESTVRELQRQGNTQTVEDLRPAYEAGARALDKAAKLTGVDTEGKTGMEIRRDVDAAAEAKKTAPLSDAAILNLALSEDSRLTDEGKAVARDMFRLTRTEETSPLEFIAGFNDVYDAARRGESPDSIQSEAAARLTPQARAAAYDAGLEAMRTDTAERYSYSVRESDGEYTVVIHDAETGRDNPMQSVSTREEAEAIINNFKGVTENAESGSQGKIRDAGVPGREGRGGLRERAEKNRAWRETRKRDAEGIRNRIKAAGDGEKVSSREAGISGGTDAKTMSIVRTYRDADMRKMESEAAAHGVKVVFFSGEIEARKGGETIKARGEYSADGKTFYVAVDDPDFTARQIFDHEDFHARAHTDAELQQICEDIIKGHSAAELQELVNAYVNTYGWTSMSDEDILQEILADAYAGIDVFQYLYSFEGATQFTEAVRGAVKERESEQQTERGPPGEAKLSEKLTNADVPKMESRLSDARAELNELRPKLEQGKNSAAYNAYLDAVSAHLEKVKGGSRFGKDDDLNAAIEEYAKWEKESGYGEAYRRSQELEEEIRNLSRAIERAQEDAAKNTIKAARANYGPEMAAKYAAKAARKFGTTSRFDLSGYLTTNGSLLNFSQGQRQRVLDHRAIAEILDFLPDNHAYSDGMIEFMNLGNIRMQSYGIDISKPPTQKQVPILRRFFNSLDGEVTVDFSDENGNTVGSIDYPEGTRADRIFADMDRYFETGNVPELSTTAQFHSMFSQKITPDYSSLLPEDYAPTFYSKLEQEIENFKGDKLGAESVVSYLRGRGVKAEEIKWSGIETFLDGKKSVSKAELQKWLRDNRLEIETETLADENGGLIEYTDEERQDLDVMHREKEKLLDRSVELWNEAYDEAIPNRIILADKVDDAITLEIINRHGGRTSFDGVESLNKAERELWDKVTDGIRRLDWQIDRIVDRAKARQKNTSKTKWSDYKLEGGENYREYLYRMPGSDYTNRAMNTHWDGKRGVLAHARVQDFTSGGQPVMFVDEIQSDWHNAGQKNGYYTGSAAEQEEKAKTIRREADELAQDFSNRTADIATIVRKAQSAINETATFPWTYQKTYGVLVRHSVNDPDYETAMSALSKDEQENIIRYREDYEYWAVRDEEADRAADAAPDAPYSKTYHEFVLKSLLRMAAEGDYDYLAWTPGWMQAERWSEQYSKGYEIEYDQDIPKFLRKYGKQWGARVTEIGLDGLSNVTVPAIEVNDAMRDSVLYEGQPQFSQKLTAEDELRQQNDELQKLVDYWRGQTKRTTAPAVRADDAEKVARDFVKSYNSKMDVKDAAAAVKALAEYIQSENVTWAEVKDRAYGIARDVVENAEALREGDGATYDEVKTALKKPLIISAQDAHDISPEWGAWRNVNVGKVNVSINGKGTPVDVAYAELSERFPSLFPESITHPADQVQQMVDVVNELAPVYENPFSYNMAEAIEYCANDLISRVYGENIRTVPPTFADKAAARLEAEKARGAEKAARVREQKDAEIADLKARNAWATAQRIAEVRKQRDAKIAALKEHYAESRKAASERKADSAARTRLLKIIRRLNNKKLPAVNRAWLEEKIGDLDTVAKSITGETIMDLTRLRSWYDNQKANNPDFIADAATEAKIARLSQTQISDLTPSQVAELTEVLLNFENEINTQRKLIDSLDKRDTRQMVLESLYNVEETKGSKKNLVDWLATNTLAPERLVKRLTGYAETDPLLMRTRELADGQRKMLDYQMRAEAKFKRWANDKKLMERLRSKERIKITGYYNGRAVEVEITPDMRMALYLHSLNDQNMKHIANGGVTIPDIDTYLKGDIGEAYTRGTTVKLSPSNIRSIASGMSAEERAYAKAAHDYFNGMSKDEVNATSEKLVGYSIAGVDDYFPIETDRNFTKSDIAELKRDGTIEGMGFLKERVNAANAINLVPLTDVLNKSIKNHAKYVGLAIPVRNFSKVWGMNAHNDAASEDNGLRKAIGKKWGERGVDAIETMIADLQNSYHKADELDKFFSKVKSNYAGAVLTLNLSVAMKQAASYPTAAAVLGWGPVAKAMKDVGRVDLDQIAKYTPLQWYRSQGYSTQELGDIRSRGGIMDRVLGTTVRVKGRDVPLFNWIQTADLLTTRKLWKASEYYVQQHNADLRRGSEEYYTAVADIYNRVIEETQPNYTTMQRPQLLRSHSAWAEILGMFKTQPFQNFNILYDATAELAAAERAAKNGDKSRLAAARRNAKNAYTSQIASLALFAAMTAAYGFLRGRDDKWRNKEGEVTVGSVATGIGRDMIGGLFSMVPGGSDVYNLGEAMATGGKYYGVSSVTVSALTDAGTAIYKAGRAISKAIEQANDPEKEVNVKALSKSMETLTLELSKALGVPAENIRNDVQIIMKTALNGAFGYYVGSYIMTRYTENMDSSYTKGDVYDLLYSAYLHDRSAYNELRRMMKEDGFTDKSMDAAIKKRSENK